LRGGLAGDGRRPPRGGPGRRRRPPRRRRPASRGRPHLRDLRPDMDLQGALTYLDAHINLEAISAGRVAAPTLDRVRALTELMGDPQHASPVIHITGTNGKGSTARMLTSLLAGRGLSVGTYTSPDLERVNERVAWNGEPISDG